MPDGSRPERALCVQRLVVRRPDGAPILSVPSLAVQPGGSLGIRGPSGAGKSTLLLALAGLPDRCEGTILWGQTDILSLKHEQRTRFRAAHMGIVFQDFLLFDELDAATNASLTAMFRPPSQRTAIRERAAGLLSRLGVPQGTRKVDSFSGGERQRVAVARALAADAPVLLADEPTASLDRAAADRLIEDLTRLARERGKTLIAASHDPQLLQKMDRVLTIVDGEISEDHHV